MSRICLHCFVTGHVQGVFYRRATCEQGIVRELKGWVKNLADGRVEVMICGEEKSVYQMQEWLWQGPDAANVKDVEIIEEPFTDYENFEVVN